MVKKKETMGHLVIEGNELAYTLVRSKKRKYSLSLKINATGQLQVNVPHKIDDKTIENFIISKYTWIKKKIKEKQAQTPAVKLTYTHGEKHWYKGVEYPLQLITANQSYVEISQDQICVYHRKNASIKNILTKWYKESALNFLQERTLLLAHKFQMPKIKAIKIRMMKARWGSCSSQSEITYNVHLIKTTLENIDYVIIHELCHLIHHNHGAQFYKIQSQLNPNWKKQKQDLNQQGHQFLLESIA